MNRKILVCVTGSIAAYKAAELVRLFIRAGDEVKVVMTPAAAEFVSPLTFRTLSRNPVALDEFEDPANWEVGHISLAEWADAAVVAPATANTISKLRFGIADNALTSTLLAVKAPVVVAPAMNTAMWTNPATVENIGVLRSRGVKIVGPVEGSLACGTSGIGHMSEPGEIFAAV